MQQTPVYVYVCIRGVPICSVCVCVCVYIFASFQCDGKRIRLPRKIQGIVVLNIGSYMAGTNFWGTDRQKDVS